MQISRFPECDNVAIIIIYNSIYSVTSLSAREYLRLVRTWGYSANNKNYLCDTTYIFSPYRKQDLDDNNCTVIIVRIFLMCWTNMYVASSLNLYIYVYIPCFPNSLVKYQVLSFDETTFFSIFNSNQNEMHQVVNITTINVALK